MAVEVGGLVEAAYHLVAPELADGLAYCGLGHDEVGRRGLEGFFESGGFGVEAEHFVAVQTEDNIGGPLEILVGDVGSVER